MTRRAWSSHAGGDFRNFVGGLGGGMDRDGWDGDGGMGREEEGRWRRIKARKWIEAIVDLWDVRNVDGQ